MLLDEDPRATLEAYDVLAPGYDLLTSGYAYERWLTGVEQLALECGLPGRRVLDVACGTGKSFAPLLERGYAVTACDGSSAMVDIAQCRAAGRATIHVADMRTLPCYGRFDLVLCLDDAINHLVDAREVVRALARMRENLAERGLLVFDVNTALAYEDHRDVIRESGGIFVAARGGGPLERWGAVVELAVDLFHERSHGLWVRHSAAWRHRHYPIRDICRFVRQAGLRIRAIRGQRRGAVIDPHIDEGVHRKALIVAGR